METLPVTAYAHYLGVLFGAALLVAAGPIGYLHSGLLAWVSAGIGLAATLAGLLLLRRDLATLRERQLQLWGEGFRTRRWLLLAMALLFAGFVGSYVSLLVSGLMGLVILLGALLARRILPEDFRPGEGQA